MKKHKLTILLMLFTFGLASVLLTNGMVINLENEIKDNNKSNMDNLKKPMVFGAYILDYIHIEGNWSETESTYEWCSGSGTFEDPYTIQKCEINADNSPTNYGIYIKDSTTLYFEISDCSIFGGTEGIHFDNICNGTIKNNFINTSSADAIVLTNSQNITVTNNLIKNAGDTTIWIENSHNNFYRKNEFRENSGYIYSTSSHNNTFLKNIISSSNSDAIQLSNSNNNTFKQNTINNNEGSGIYFNGNCENNSIIENSINNNTNIGIDLSRDKENFHNNTFYGNILIDNNKGIEIDSNCKDNLLYYNCLINNTQNAVENSPDNFWNSSTTGNYWSNYTGGDTSPEDGIGDTPFAIWGDGNAIDNFPLMNYELVSIDNPSDLSHEAGTPNKIIKWEIICKAPNSELTYEIWRNSSLISSGYLETYFDEKSIDLAGLNGGLYEYTIKLDDGFGEKISDTVLVNITNTKPSLTKKPKDMILEIGDTNKTLQWNFTDISVNNPVYSIKKNGTVIIPDHECNPNELINLSLGDLSLGIYTFNIEITEGFGEILTDSVKINVSNTLPSFLTKPDDLSFEVGATNYSLIWKFSDVSTNNSKFTLWRNNTKVIVNKTCGQNEAINISLSDLDQGTYIYKIEINDGYGGTVEDEVKVVVTSAIPQNKPNAISGWPVGIIILNISVSLILMALILAIIISKKPRKSIID